MAAVLTVAGLVAPTSHASPPTEDSGPADWALPTESVTESPKAIATDVGRHEAADVVVLTAGEAGLEVDTVPIDGRREAVAAIADAQDEPGVVSVGVDQPVRAFADPLQGKQWALDMMRTPTAWNSATGAGVVVAVIDSGVDSTHPDLRGALVAGKNTRSDRGDYSDPTSDPNGHGTHVAGIIAARSGNGEGISGVAPDAAIMPVKALDAEGAGFMSDVLEGIVWAADRGADVINMSLGGPDATFTASAVSYAQSKGVVVIAAAGNEGSSQLMYPAALPGVLAVAAVDQDGQPAGYSNHGASWVDVAAPGTQITSTLPGGRYAAWSGTSMATPQVAGVAALIRSVAPAADAAAVIMATAYDAGSPGHDRAYGTGVVDAAAAVSRVAPALSPAAESPTSEAPTAQPALRAQSVRIPAKVKIGRAKSLPATTRQGVAIRTWRTTTPRRCAVVTRGDSVRVVGKRAGSCTLRVTALGTSDLAPLKTKARLRVVKG